MRDRDAIAFAAPPHWLGMSSSSSFIWIIGDDACGVKEVGMNGSTAISSPFCPLSMYSSDCPYGDRLLGVPLTLGPCFGGDGGGFALVVVIVSLSDVGFGVLARGGGLGGGSGAFGSDMGTCGQCGGIPVGVVCLGFGRPGGGNTGGAAACVGPPVLITSSCLFTVCEIVVLGPMVGNIGGNATDQGIGLLGVGAIGGGGGSDSVVAPTVGCVGGGGGGVNDNVVWSFLGFRGGRPFPSLSSCLSS